MINDVAVIFVNVQITDDLRKRLQEQIDLQMKRLYEGFDSVDQSDYSIYTGTTGRALAFSSSGTVRDTRRDRQQVTLPFLGQSEKFMGSDHS